MASPNEERRGLTQSFRTQMGYGTATLSAATKKNTPKTRKFISRTVCRTDTLMGIALKYGVSVQDLKKENKLWTNDHLFLRENLLIPLTPENENLLDENDTVVVYNGSSSSGTSPSSSQSHLPNGDVSSSHKPSSPSLPHKEGKSNSMSDPSAGSSSSKQQNGSNGQATNGGASAAASGVESGAKSRSQSTPAGSDFFSKYDTSIARLKGDVAKMEKNAASLDGLIDSNPLSLPARKGSGASRKGSTSSTSSIGERRGRILSDEDNSPVLLIRSRTTNRHVKSTIENLQQVNDDLFEL